MSAETYQPSVGLAATGAVLFTLVALIATWAALRYKAWVLIFFIFGIYLEAAALISRTYWAADLTAVGGFLLAYFGAIIAPSFLAAGCYMVFGRLVWLMTPAQFCSARYLWVPPRWITPLFVTIDLFSFFVQFLGVCALGSAYNSKGPRDQAKETSGSHTLRFGLILQLMCFVLFAVIALRLTWLKWRRIEAPKSPMYNQTAAHRLHMAILASATVIALRAIYRVVEFTGNSAQGNLYIRTHEWTYWIFDAIPAFVVSILLTAFHAGILLPRELCRLRCNRATISYLQQHGHGIEEAPTGQELWNSLKHTNGRPSPFPGAGEVSVVDLGTVGSKLPDRPVPSASIYRAGPQAAAHMWGYSV